MQITRPNAFLAVFHSNGTKQPDHGNPKGVTLTNAVTYYVSFGGEDALLAMIHAQWDSAIILTSVEIEYACNPDVSLFSATAGEWVKDNAVGAFGGCQSTAGGTATALTLAVAGGTAGGAVWHSATGHRRGRLKVVVGGTGGVMKFTSNAKA